MNKLLSWQIVFDGGNKHYGHIDILFGVVKKTGYRFFTFNGQVYTIIGDRYSITEMTDADIV